MKRTDLTPSDNYEATYCPEDDKLRLYVGRVPRGEYEFLRAEGWTSTPKQPCDFVAYWSPERHATALQYAGNVGDEDTPPTERAADRAERFAGYRDKRESEARTRADNYNASSLGFQSQARADRAERKLEREAVKAEDQWSKAEYWQRRTAGVISNALHRSSPEVRMGRIKELEAAIRKAEKSREEYNANRRRWLKIADSGPSDALEAFALQAAYLERGDYTHPRTGKKSYLYDLATESESNPDPLKAKELAALYLARHPALEGEGPWLRHYRLRLDYEHQMLEAQGSRAAMVEMEPGGFIGGHQIHKVTKSPTTGRVVSVEVRFMSYTDRWGNPCPDGQQHERRELINIERASADAYRPPTDEERAAFAESQREELNARKAASKAKKEAGEDCPLINPNEEDASKLQAIWNDEATRRKEAPGEVCLMTQDQYASVSKGYGVRASTVIICEHGTEHRTRYGRNLTRFSLFKVRKLNGGYMKADRVIVLTDKPKKQLPWERLEKARAKCPTVEGIKPRLPEVHRALGKAWSDQQTPEEKQLVIDAVYLGLAYYSSESQKGLTETGLEHLREVTQHQAA